jgi:TolB protein
LIIIIATIIFRRKTNTLGHKNLEGILKTTVISIIVILCAGIIQAQDLATPQEIHLKNIQQLTFGGENAEAYFAGDNSKLCFQTTRDSLKCDQIFSMEIDGKNVRMLSNGLGRTTCSFFNPKFGDLIYASTYLADPNCPEPPSMAQGYVWAVYPGFDIFSVKSGDTTMTRLTKTDGYDAEGVFSPDGTKIAFTSVRDGDLEIYIMNSDGSDVKRVTNHPGYDGGAFFSPDGAKLVFRAQVFKSDQELADYHKLLKDGLVRPSALELFTINIDGSDRKQITDNGAANFAPFYHPLGKKIIFSSNMGDPKGREFDIYMVGIDGKNIERITYSDGFDGFPMFSYDGKKLVFASNRHDAKPHETNIFIADWAE